MKVADTSQRRASAQWQPIQGVPVNWQNECVCPLFEKNRASQVAFGKRLKLSKNLLKLKRLKLKRLKL
jgi:hypothetical protein